MEALDDPKRAGEVRRIILGKPALKRVYAEIYGKYTECLSRCPARGLAIELGSGAGFAKEVIPELVTTDVLPYEGIDRVVDATRMPFEENSLRMIVMFDVFHHVPDVAAFFREAIRCLVPGGRVLIVDQHLGWISTPILRYLHHEPFRPEAATWRFDSTGPLSGANGALAWMVFVRDRQQFQREFPELCVVRYQPIMPLRYWFAGGLKRWSLLPTALWSLATLVDRALIGLSGRFGSFTEIELVKSPVVVHRAFI